MAGNGLHFHLELVALKKAFPEATLEIIGDAGHASTEPGIVDALVRATDAALKL